MPVSGISDEQSATQPADKSAESPVPARFLRSPLRSPHVHDNAVAAMTLTDRSQDYITAISSSISRRSLSCALPAWRRPQLHFLIKLNRAGMIRHGKVGQRLHVLGPLLEERMDRLQLRQIIPPGLQHRVDGLVADVGHARQMERIADHVGIALDARRRPPISPPTRRSGQEFYWPPACSACS